MNNACPTCATVYTVTPTDVGRRIACAKCGTNLRVADGGLEVEANADAVPVPTPKATDSPLLIAAKNWAKDIDPPTFLFSAGILVVLFFVSMPFVAAAKVERRLAQSQEATFEHAIRIRALQEKKESEKAIQDAEEKWSKTRTSYEEAVEYAKFDKSKGAYWERYGLLLGNLMVAGGAVWLLRTEQPLVKRIVAGVVVTVQILLAFQTVTPLGCGSAARAAGLPPPGMGEGWGGGRLRGEGSTPHPNPPPQGGRGPEGAGEGMSSSPRRADALYNRSVPAPTELEPRT